jgi:uncharacterized membrane protein (DUF106 family)
LFQVLEKEREEERERQQALLNKIKMQKQQVHDDWKDLVKNPSLKVIVIVILHFRLAGDGSCSVA